MRYLILIRHGEFDEGQETLNQKGREQIKNLVPKIKQFKPKIYSSLGPRSIESASILAGGLESQYIPLDIFHSIDTTQEALIFLKQTEENIAVVSRGEFLNPFAAHLAKEFFDKGLSIRPILKGNGLIFDIKLGTYATISA